jgi:hypothetical protein
MLVKTPYFLKQRNLARRSKAGRSPEKKDGAERPYDFTYLRSGRETKRQSRRITGPSFVKACSYQSFERAATTEEEVRARRGTTRNGDPHKMVFAESNEASPFW